MANTHHIQVHVGPLVQIPSDHQVIKRLTKSVQLLNETKLKSHYFEKNFNYFIYDFKIAIARSDILQKH